MSNGLANIGVDLATTVFGGILLAVLFFLSKEKIFPLPKVTGRWHFKIVTETSDYNPYLDMELRYVALLCRDGTRIEGTIEKIYERSSTGERGYVGKNRTRGTVSGYIEKNYFSHDKIYLHIVERGHGRESSNFHELANFTDGIMDGKFYSMVADQSGTVRWQRTSF